MSSEAFKAIKSGVFGPSFLSSRFSTLVNSSLTCLLSVPKGRRAFVPISLYLEFSEAPFASPALYVSPTHSLGLQAKVPASGRPSPMLQHGLEAPEWALSYVHIAPVFL